MNKIKDFFLGSMGRKVIIIFTIFIIVFCVGGMFVVNQFFTQFVMEDMSEGIDLRTDYLKAQLGEGEWELRDGKLYHGGVLMGDGTNKNANNEPFVDFQKHTDSYAFLMMRTPDEGLKKVETASGSYQQGHYVRIAGSTKDSEGNSIVGTYINKDISDMIEKQHSYKTQSDLFGGEYFSNYTLLKDKNGENIGVLGVGFSMQEIQDKIDNANGKLFRIMIIPAVTALILISVIFQQWTKKFKKIEEYLQRIESGDLTQPSLKIDGIDEAGKIGASINRVVESLKERDRISAELTVATDIQASMLPNIHPEFANKKEYDISALMVPAKEVGGDFYDFFMIDDQRIAVVIADVSGKGVPAALFMAIAKAYIKDFAQSNLTLGQVFTKANQNLCQSNSMGMFVTAWMGVLDLSSGKLTYVNAGHNKPLVYTKDKGFEYLNTKAKFVLAGLEGVRYKEDEIQLNVGDKLLLYTDGVPEATRKDERMYGDDRLKDFLNSKKFDSSEFLVQELYNDVEKFIDGADQFDDITILSLAYNQVLERDLMLEKTVKATIENWNEVNDFIEDEMRYRHISAKTIMQVLTAVEEIYVNVANYAYSENIGEVKIEMGIKDNIVTIRLSDFGMPFDPLAKDDPDINLSAEEREIGGLGIYMTKKIMDNVEYKHENSQNILTLSKQVELDDK